MSKDDLKPKFQLLDKVKLIPWSTTQPEWANADLSIGEIKFNRKLNRVEYSVYDANEPVEYGFTYGFQEHEIELVSRAEAQAVDVEDILTEIYNSNGFCEISSDISTNDIFSILRTSVNHLHSRNLIRGVKGDV